VFCIIELEPNLNTAVYEKKALDYRLQNSSSSGSRVQAATCAISFTVKTSRFSLLLHCVLLRIYASYAPDLCANFFKVILFLKKHAREPVCSAANMVCLYKMGEVRGAGLFLWLYGMVALDGGVEWMV
jgi:hypothetical protein